MKKLLITQARLGSTRLPNKILKKINKVTLLEIHLNRIKKAKTIDDIFIATTTKNKDDEILKLANKLGFKCYRGSENDVLDRFYKTAITSKTDYIIRVTSDCPLIDPNLIDEVVNAALDSGVDYYSNIFDENYPDGQDIEVFKFKALEDCWKNAKKKSDREHVTSYIRNNSINKGKQTFSSKSHTSNFDYGDVRMTVDNIEDFKVIEKLVKKLGLKSSWKEYADYYLNNEDIFKLNQNILRNEGYLKSIKNNN